MLAYIFVVLAVGYRFMPHPGWWNLTPLAASLLFFGAKQPRARLWMPLVVAFLADLALNVFVYHYRVGLESLVSVAYYAGVLLLGGVLKKNSSTLRVVGASVTMSVGFFLVSNFSSWLAMPGLYSRTLAGLVECYVAGIPFFRGTLAGDLFFSAVFFGIAAYVAGREAEHHLAA